MLVDSAGVNMPDTQEARALSHVSEVATKLLGIARWVLVMFGSLLVFSVASAFQLGQWFARFDGRMGRIEETVSTLADGVVAANSLRSQHNDDRLDAFEHWSERIAEKLKLPPPVHPREAKP